MALFKTSENSETFAARYARESREKFAVIKASAQTELEKARVAAYEAHVESVKEKNEKWGTNFNPHGYDNFQWKMCVLCKKEIRDDPFGHNPFPLKKKGVCCGKCNEDVVDARLPPALRGAFRGVF